MQVKTNHLLLFGAVAGLSAISFAGRLRQAFKRMPLLSLPLCLLLTSLTAKAQMQPFSLQQVKLLAGPFQQAQQVDLQYILALKPDKLLAPYLIDAGLPLKAERYGNWESSGLDGHIAGHYLSALAMMYASTGHSELKIRLEYMVSELARCQAKNGNGYVGGIPQGKVFWDRIHRGDIDGSSFGLNNTWVPLYNIHKLFAGLRDAYQITGNQQAKTVLISLSDWFIELIRPLSDTQIQQILRTEHGGINEVFADLYTITNDKKYLETAQKVSHKAILEPLIHKEDKLTGLHANTQIPKVIGFQKIATITLDAAWSDAAEYFWQNVTQQRSVAFGGNSVREHFNPVNDFSKMLESNQGPETCNSYNMLRLSRALFLDKSHPAYLEFYERALYNHILSSQHPQKGGFVYFTPIRPNHYRVYSQPETSMWCCVGSGIENHSKYAELIYSHQKDSLYVNLFIPSQLNWQEKGITLTQNTQFPYQNRTELRVKLTGKKRFALLLRNPTWAEQVQVSINGKPEIGASSASGYFELHRIWKNGDKISLQFLPKTKTEPLPDGSNWQAFVHGPIVLAAKTSTDNLTGLFADDSRMGHETKGKLMPINKAYALVGDANSSLANLKPIGNLRFSLDSLVLQPFFEIHEARYQMYFQTFSEEEFSEHQKARKSAEEALLALEEKTVDKVTCGEQQPEVDHQYQGQKSYAGYDNDSFWRATRSFFSYTLQNKNNQGIYVKINALDEIKPENIALFINENPAEIIISGPKTIRLRVPTTETILIKIASKNGEPSPRFKEIRLLKE